jgi:signal transduction histidine kinase
LLLKNGFFKILVLPVKNKDLNIGCVIVFRDINKEKEIERIKEDFTSMIVHELRSPLDTIKKMIEMMRATKMKKQSSQEVLQMIYGSSSDMLELVNNLLNIAKIEAGKFELRKEPSNIKETINSRVVFFEALAQDAKVSIKSQLSPDLPNKIEYDPHTISQVLNNFISNAIKFNKENGQITVQALLHKKQNSLIKEAGEASINWFINKDIQVDQDSLFVAVTNTGLGISDDQIGKLFNKFFQVKTEFAQKGGTGLGLAIAKSIIESHGGMVGVQSTKGQGATFYFTIPIN